jgi:formaldehyde-activating enzyme
MVSKVTVDNSRYTNILMGSVQAGIANGVLDAVRQGIIPKEKANDWGIIYSVWLDPSVNELKSVDHGALFEIHWEATVKSHSKVFTNEPGIDWLLEHQATIEHYFHQLGMQGEL